MIRSIEKIVLIAVLAVTWLLWWPVTASTLNAMPECQQWMPIFQFMWPMTIAFVGLRVILDFAGDFHHDYKQKIKALIPIPQCSEQALAVILDASDFELYKLFTIHGQTQWTPQGLEMRYKGYPLVPEVIGPDNSSQIRFLEVKKVW